MIRDYAELIAEVTDRTGYTGVANKAAMYVGMAEDYMREALRIGSTNLIQDFDGLEVANTNWLLEHSPKAYLQAVMYQVYEAQGDAENGATFKNLLDQTLAKIEYDAKLLATKGVNFKFPSVAT